MYRARRFDEVAVALQRQGGISGYGQSTGQEGVQVGCALAVADSEMVFPSYRQTAVALELGVTLREFFAFYSRLDLCPWDWRKLGFAPYTIPVGSQLSHAVGWAMAEQRRHSGRATFVFFGDGASSQGEVHEAMNLAGVAAAPVVFICENNGYAISTPFAQQTHAPSLASRAQGYGMPGYQVDGNDCLAVLEVVARSAEMVRAGNGPVLVEALTYRIGGHTTSDDPTLYRSTEEVDLWRTRDPIQRFVNLCNAEAVISDEELSLVRTSINAEIDAAVDAWLQERHGAA
jgi:pyruvate dehydrogenase E1 component alpha subunit